MISAQIVGDTITGTTGSLGLSLQGSLSTGSGTPATYTASTLGTSPAQIELLVGTDGRAFGFTSTGLSGSGTLSTSGALSLTGEGFALIGTLSSGALAGTFTTGGATVSFAGLAAGMVPVQRLVNVSSLGAAGGGEAALIGGFVLTGSGTKQILIRAAGPGLAAFGTTGALARPVLTLQGGGGILATNRGWSTAPNAAAIAAAATSVGAFAFAENSGDSAILMTLPEGAYTASVTGAGGASGPALVEIYEVGATSPKILNLATRGTITPTATLSAGLVVTGNAPKRILVRVVGPTLGAFGVAGAISDPQLQVFQNNTVIAANDNWESASAASGAFALPAGSKDAALLLMLAPGNYSVVGSARGSASGIALIEIYDVP